MIHDAGTLAGIRSSGAYVLGVGVHNAATARLAERSGFDVLWVSSLETSTAKMLPDANVITFTEMADVVRDIRRATSIPVLVDADNGYGSDETAVRAAQEFYSAGATAMCIEDNAFPKRCSFYEGVNRLLEDPDTFCRRIEAVRTAVARDRLEIIARTEGLVAGLGVQETVERVRAYVNAGADAIFVQTNKLTIREFELVLNETRGLAPIVVTPTALPEVSASQLHALGADVVIYSNVVIRTITKALSDTLANLREKESLNDLSSQIAPLEAIFDLAGTYNWIGSSGSSLEPSRSRDLKK